MNKTMEIYTLSERLWHWIQALLMILLILTGFQMHYPGFLSFLWGFSVAVRMHSILAFILLANAFLGFFYQVSTAGIRRYLPMPVDFTRGMLLQGRFYLRGILRGEPHPFEKSARERLNPLQKVTYFGLLNFALPFQIATGVLCWGSTRWPVAFEAVGGLRVLAPLHTLGSYMFVSFLIGHVYMTTTGHTPLANLKAMITGREDVPGPSNGE